MVNEFISNHGWVIFISAILPFLSYRVLYL